ncbi:ANL_collapsed_G0028670.mRNA.1.CDS.1 [Saccharomyces cerevisiae]|nr:ANL_collapsed_G0028670.mRNA.1.CDS.1 [Saccharomyces cerevisiae]
MVKEIRDLRPPFFPLIYGTNVGIRRILEGLNFRRIGKLPEAGILKGFDVPVDSFMYGKEFTHITKSIDLLRDPQKSIEIGKYERLKHFSGNRQVSFTL